MDSLDALVLERVLADDPASKQVTFQARFEGRAGNAILSVARRHFGDLDSLQSLLRAHKLLQPPSLQNDVYLSFEAVPPPLSATITVNITFPATETQIAKATQSPSVMLSETPDLYESCTRPYVQSIPSSALNWVDNVLDGTKEAERVILSDPDPELGFVLARDAKWDGKHVKELYALAIVRRKYLRSIRDLTPAHLPLLRHIRDSCLSAITASYGVSAAGLRVYLHYVPTFWHLHIHFVNCHSAIANSSAVAGRAHLLDDIADYLERAGSEIDCMRRRTITCVFSEKDPLLVRLRQRLDEKQMQMHSRP